MNKRYIKWLLLGLMPLGAATAVAQNGTNSPYSRYGFGLLSDQASGFNKGSAGAGLAVREGTSINFQNPASYSAIDSVSFLFDAGLSLQNANFSGSGKRVNDGNTSIDYLSVAFRAWPHVGLSLGFMPFSNIGYKFTGSQTMPDIDEYGEKRATTSYSGEGGLHQVYLGLGWQPVKHLAVGVNASYLWGDYNHTAAVSFSESSIQPLRRYYEANLSTYKLDFGVQYEHLVSKQDLLSVGATYGLGHSFDSRAKFINQILTSAGAVQNADTLTAADAFALPHSFGLGLAWNHSDRWQVALDYTLQLWSQAKLPTLSETQGTLSYSSNKHSFNDRHHVALGAEYVHNTMGVRYIDHTRFRAGLAYSTGYTKVNGHKEADDYLLSLGVGLPIANRYNNRSLLNVAAQWEHVRPRSGGMITENYLRLSIGLSFNERWFMKRKVN